MVLVPRAPMTPWANLPTVKANPERLPEADRPLYCTCDPYPCTEETCRRHLGGCAACEKYGRALFTRAEVRWVDTGKGLPAAEVEALGQLWGAHEGHNSRLIREGLPKYGTGSEPPETVADAC